MELSPSRPNESSCAQTIEHFPDDVMVEILCRLPYNILARFKTVSKSWHSLISNICVPLISTYAPNYLFGLLVTLVDRLDLHLERCRTHLNCDGLRYHARYACYKCGKDHDRDSRNPCDNYRNMRYAETYSKLLPFNYEPRDLVHCCNGLILFRTGSISRYYLCSPLTKQCIAIPMFSGLPQPCYESLAFTPDEFPHYRIFCIPHQCSDHMLGTTDLYIFSSETGKWGRCQLTMKSPNTLYDEKRMKRVVYLNGMLYQLSFSKYLIVYDLKAAVVYAIDLPLKEETGVNGFIGVSKGDLHYGNKDKSRMLLWVLKEDGRGHCHWDLKDCMSFSELKTRGCGFCLHIYRNSELFNVYAIHPTSDVVFLGSHNRIASYDLRTKEVVTVMNCYFAHYIYDGFDTVFPYSQCFVVLKKFSAESNLEESTTGGQQQSGHLQEVLQVGTRY